MLISDVYKNKELLNRDFYNRQTTLVAVDMLGKILAFSNNNEVLAAKIVEVEAYLGTSDPACHAYVGKTKRSKVFWEGPGIAYVFVNYGIYHCLNAITLNQTAPGCVLIRAVEPIMGIKTMKRNRNKQDLISLTNGPGKLTQAFGITLDQNGTDLITGDVRVFDNTDDYEVLITSRVGISKAKQEPLRFCIKDNSFVSKHRGVIQYEHSTASTLKEKIENGTLQISF